MSTVTKDGGHSTDAVANEFLSIPEAKGKISPMKLQKLVYYAHGWCLALTDGPLVSEQVQAWKYGPVFPTLYAEFRDYSRKAIDRLALEVEFVKSDESSNFVIRRYEPRLGDEASWEKLLVKRIWDLIGHYSPLQLSTLTHQPGTPWDTVASQFEGHLPQGVAIPNQLIRDYFHSLLKKD